MFGSVEKQLCCICRKSLVLVLVLEIISTSTSTTSTSTSTNILRNFKFLYKCGTLLHAFV